MLKLKMEADVEICFDKEVYEARILDPTTAFEEKGIKIKAHQEIITVISPEDLAQKLKEV